MFNKHTHMVFGESFQTLLWFQNFHLNNFLLLSIALKAILGRIEKKKKKDITEDWQGEWSWLKGSIGVYV